jgi:hypothetical protein
MTVSGHVSGGLFLIREPQMVPASAALLLCCLSSRTTTGTIDRWSCSCYVIESGAAAGADDSTTHLLRDLSRRPR